LIARNQALMNRLFMLRWLWSLYNCRILFTTIAKNNVWSLQSV